MPNRSRSKCFQGHLQLGAFHASAPRWRGSSVFSDRRLSRYTGYSGSDVLDYGCTSYSEKGYPVGTDISSIVLSCIADGAVRGGKGSDVVNRFIAGNAADGVMVVVA